jgi:predicted DNA-binding transcriptional regulator YafY
LFLVAGPRAASPEVRAALRKLVRALPEPLREGAQAASNAMVVDPSGWDRHAPERPPPTHLDAIQRAVIDGEQVWLGYVARDRSVTERIVHPLGLAAKGLAWYLVAGTDAGLRTFRVDRVSSVKGTGERVIRPDGFSLAEAWRGITESVDRMRTPIRARALADPAFVNLCRWTFGTRLGIGPTLRDGRVQLELRGHHIRSLAGELAGFGAGLEVLEPQELRDHLAAIGAQLVDTYGGGPVG